MVDTPANLIETLILCLALCAVGIFVVSLLTIISAIWQYWKHGKSTSTSAYNDVYVEAMREACEKQSDVLPPARVFVPDVLPRYEDNTFLQDVARDL